MAKAQMRSVLPRVVRWRAWIQTAFLVAWLDPFLLRAHNICSPVFHCYACPLATLACPIGVLANFSALHVFPFIALGTLLLVGGVVGGFVCGWACPFGFLQDLVGRIPVRKFQLPPWTGHLRYVVLAALVVAVPFFLGEAHPLFVCRVCPAGALEGAVPNVVQQAVTAKAVTWPSATKIVILVAFLGAMFIKHRPWCTLLCPLGAIFGTFNRVAAVYLKVDREACTSCGACHKQCKYGLKPEFQMNDPLCIRCMECSRCSAIAVRTVLGKSSEGGGVGAQAKPSE